MLMSFVEVFLSLWIMPARVVDVAWTDIYFFKIDHKNGYQHVPIHEDSRKFFGCFFLGRILILFLQSDLLGGNLVLWFIIPLQKLWLCIVIFGNPSACLDG